MGGGDAGGSAPTMPSISVPLNGMQRQDIFNSALQSLQPYMPSRSEYKGYEIVDPSADRGRGTIYPDKLTGYAGYSNRAPIESKESVYNERDLKSVLDDYFSKLQLSNNSTTSQFSMDNPDRFVLYNSLAELQAAAPEATNIPIGFTMDVYSPYNNSTSPVWYDSVSKQSFMPTITNAAQFNPFEGFTPQYDTKNLPQSALTLMTQKG